MPDAVVDELLEAWKQGEQLLPTLPPLSTDHETVRAAVADLRATYVVLVDRDHPTNPHPTEPEEAVRRAMRAIKEVSNRTPRRP